VKALIKVGYGCNENCTFCHTLDVRHIEGSAASVHTKIERAKQLGHTMVVLSGGEPTIRPELQEWAAHIAELGMDFGLVTNGLVFNYEQVVESLLRHRLKYVYMSLHGGSAEIHDRLVRAHTFEQARAGLRNLAGRGLDLTINAVITRQNLEHLRPIVDLVLPYPDVTLKFSMVQPKGGGDRAFASLMPRVTEVAARVCEAIDYALARTKAASGPRFAHDGIPFCLLPGHEQRYEDLKTHRFWTMTEVGESDFFPVDDVDKLQPEPCRGCALAGPCPGLFRGYHEIFGDGELRPIRERPRSNSFNYVFETLLPSVADDVCPIREGGVAPWDRGRHLFVRNDGRIARFRTSTRDFSDAEVAEIKHARGQVYVDRSQKRAPDDFQNDLVPLTRAPLCAPCPERAHCTGLYEPVFEDVFGRDDERVREILRGLGGEVLDVGCGDGPYDELLSALVQAGQLRYLGVDPDAARLAQLRARRSWGTLEVASAETLVVDEARFDHVLILRSWNHLRDPRAALTRLVAAMRPEATLTVVDNVAFGLARTPAQAARGESSPAAFEHYRNDGAEDALRLASAFPLRLIERHDVGPGSSNQWLLRLQRA
jgi:MoaA/NifB/PqqE/SkfB family radical SAM enzyme/2-polyprenyl-3-methyl-5-hydroxy-6-metoxy-1,4-benzoquinol methylase